MLKTILAAWPTKADFWLQNDNFSVGPASLQSVRISENFTKIYFVFPVVLDKIQLEALNVGNTD